MKNDLFVLTTSLTDVLGETYQYVAYLPWGEIFVEERNTQTDRNPYLYNGKELDEMTGLYYYGARYYDASVGLFLGVDPMAEKNFDRSPYHFVSNNPLNRIDPDGRDDFELNGKGQIVNRIENDKADNIFILNKDGERTEGRSISFEYGTIKDVKNPTVKVKDKEGNIIDKKLTLFEVNGDENATEMFEFLANPANTSVEWTHAKIGTKDSDKNIVGSSHDKSSTPVGHYLRITKYTLKEVIHNHPSGNYLPSRGDKNGATLYKKVNSNVKLYIYTHPNRYSEYDEKGTLDFSDFGPAIEVIGTKKK